MRPGQVDHWLACADVALWAEGRWGEEAVVSERELRFAEQDPTKPIASCVVGELPGGRPMLHRPDLVVTDADRRMAIEVELTTKAPRRLEHLVRSWRRARHVEKVLYVVPAGPTQRAVERAVATTHARERVAVYELERVNGADEGTGRGPTASSGPGGRGDVEVLADLAGEADADFAVAGDSGGAVRVHAPEAVVAAFAEETGTVRA